MRKTIQTNATIRARCFGGGQLKYKADASSFVWQNDEPYQRPKNLRSQVATSEGSAELFILDEIGPWWMGLYGAETLLEDLRAVGARRANVHINSPGGEVFEGVAIYNLLATHPAGVDTQIDGIAASISSVIAMAGETISIAEAGMFMIHNPWTLALGESREMRAVADVLDLIRDQIVGVYEARTGMNREQLSGMMDATTYIKAVDAVDSGFADAMIPNRRKTDATTAETIDDTGEQAMSPSLFSMVARSRLRLKLRGA